MNCVSFEQELVQLRKAIEVNKTIIRSSKLELEDLDASIETVERSLDCLRAQPIPVEPKPA